MKNPAFVLAAALAVACGLVVLTEAQVPRDHVKTPTSLVTTTVINCADDCEIVAAQTSGDLKISVYALCLYVDADVTVYFESATTSISGEWDLGAAGEAHAVCLQMGDLPYFSTAASAALNIELDAANDVDGFVVWN